MNLFFKSYRIYLIFFLLITWEHGFNCGIAQESIFYPTPWIQEIKLPDFYDDIPNESFYLDHLGHLFLGKDNGLTIIHEDRSVHLQMEGPVFVTGNGSDTVFFTCRNDLGFLLMEEQGGISIHSVKDRIPRAFRTFVPTQLIYSEDVLFLNTDQGIYRFQNGRLEIFPYPMHETRLHLLEGDLFLVVRDKGTFLWSGDEFIEVIRQDQTGDSPAILMDFADNQLYIITENGGKYTGLGPGRHPEMVAYLPDILDVSFIDRINHEERLAVSPDKGIWIMDRTGRTLCVLGNKMGLPDRDIRQICVYDRDELWILGPHSLHKINYPAPLNILELDPAVLGRIFVSKVLENRVILGTSHGLFIAKPLGPITGSWILQNFTSGITGVFNLLGQTDNTIFAGGTETLISIRDENLEKLASGNFTGLQAVDRDLLLASGEDGLLKFRRSGDGWKKTIIDPSFSSAFSFATFDGNIFFLCQNEAFRVSKDLEDTQPIPFHREELLYRLFPMDGELYLVTESQVYSYEESEETFLPVSGDHKSRILSSADIIIPDSSGGYWMVRHHGKYQSLLTHADRSGAFEENGGPFPVLQDLGEIIDLNIRDSILYLTGISKVSLFDLTALSPGIGEASVRIEPVNAPGQEKSTRFQLAGLEFQSAPEPVFRYKLVPEQETWSDWSDNRVLVFDRLRPGQYKIIAQSRDLYGRASAPAEYRFEINAPFYRTWYAYTFYGLVLLILLFLVQKIRLLGYQRAESKVSQRMQNKLDDLTVEKEKSDKLVAEILPERTVAQLKSEGKAKWDKYDRATVLFSDIQGFTKIAEEMNPEALIDELDRFFFHFDSVVEKYNIEKIKTIGDAYMAAGGIPERNSTNPVEVVLAALEMQAYMQQLKSSKTDIWDLRIGIHTGPVIAGVVGHKKVSYDIWGDTVNTASRMESSGLPGKVNISGITYGMVKEYFICEYRGRLPVKYKGNIDMYFVNGLRPELSVDLKGIPNKRFFTKLQLLRLGDLEEKVFGTILSDLPASLHFHRIEYAHKVYDQSFLLCRAEEVEQEDRLLVRTAALMLFTGLTQSYNNFENRSSVIAREILPGFKYSEVQIDQICNLILSTKPPFHPNNLLEKILIDAKMEYIGRPDYSTQIKLLFQELIEAGVKLNGQQFKKQQLELLYGFKFYTVAAQRLREVSGEDQMTILEQERWI
jgi:adenylate cyclase